MCRSNALWALAALTVGAVLAACGSSSSSKNTGSASTAPTTSPPASIEVQSYSGTARALDGTWVRCEPMGTKDELGTAGVGGVNFTMIFDDFPPGSGCIGTKTHALSASGTLAVSGTKAGVSWSDGSGLVSAPTLASGAAALPDPITPSVIDMHVSLSDSGQLPIDDYPGAKLWYVDDSAAVWELYEEMTGTGLAACDDTSKAGKCLNIHPFIKQP